MRTQRCTGRLLALTGACLLAATAAGAASTPAQKCEVGKNKTAGKYAGCLQGAEAGFAQKGDQAKHDKAVSGCETRFLSTWLKLEAKAAAGGATCRDGVGTGDDFGKVIAEDVGNITAALKGGALGEFTVCQGDLAKCQSDLTVAQLCGNGVIDAGEDCDQGNLADVSCVSLPGFKSGRLECGKDCRLDTSGCSAMRLVDNGNGTVTDLSTELQWEKKTDDGTVHDKDNLYVWGSGNVPNGTAFTNFLPMLNGVSANGTSVTQCFAGHCDWRLPTIVELQTIADKTVVGCHTGGPCIAPVFGPTQAFLYWSATSHASIPSGAWTGDFDTGNPQGYDKTNTSYVRAVRNF